MKNLSVSDDVLHFNTLSAASNEKSATLVLLEHLAEVDQRRLYATLAYSSLWDYVHKALGYSEAQSSERVNAMRVMVQVPEVRVQSHAHRNREACHPCEARKSRACRDCGPAFTSCWKVFTRNREGTRRAVLFSSKT